MKPRKIRYKLTRLLKALYYKLFRTNDSAQKKALGLGIGVFTGILPGTGPLAALFLASILRLNRATALLGSLVTNTWLSFITFLLAIKLGSAILHIDWQMVRENYAACIKDFHFADLFKLSVIRILAPLGIGYLVIAAGLGILVYLAAILLITIFKHREVSDENKG